MERSRIWEALTWLVGIWEGTGEGQYPTMAPFTYREHLEVYEDEARKVFHYRQRTWRGNDAELASHMELGFIGVDEDGSIDALNAQGSDRVEVLKGLAVVKGNMLSVDMRSVALAGDERMINSWRKLQLDGDSLHYTMGMATERVPDGDLHLTAHLKRQ